MDLIRYISQVRQILLVLFITDQMNLIRFDQIHIKINEFDYIRLDAYLRSDEFAQIRLDSYHRLDGFDQITLDSYPRLEEFDQIRLDLYHIR